MEWLEIVLYACAVLASAVSAIVTFARTGKVTKVVSSVVQNRDSPPSSTAERDEELAKVFEVAVKFVEAYKAYASGEKVGGEDG